jgi:hypothetical protein
MRQAFGGTHDGAQNGVSGCRHHCTRMANAANRRRTPLVRVVMVDVGRAVDVSGSIVTPVHMQIAGEIVVKVDGPGQHRRRLRHEAAGRRRLRGGNHGSLLDERSHPRQHQDAGDPSELSMQAQSHLSLLRDPRTPNKAGSAWSELDCAVQSGTWRVVRRSPSNLTPLLGSNQEANVWWKICCFTGAVALLWGSGSMSWAQQSTSQQPPLQRDDPATSGAGPTSGAPGQLNYDPPKDGSVTTDSRGVTTTSPKSDNPKTDDVPRDRGNESVGTAPRR